MSTPTPDVATVQVRSDRRPSPISRAPDAAEVAGPRASTIVLIASPDRYTMPSLTAGLLDFGVGRVLQVESVARLEEIICGAVGGDLALVSVAFGVPTARLIEGLCRVGWERVIALVPTSEPSTFAAALHAGATGVLVRKVHPWLADPPTDPAGAEDLSPRELDVIRLVAEGHSNRWIGRELLLSSATIKTHLARIGRKLGTGHRAQIVVVALRAGIID